RQGPALVLGSSTTYATSTLQDVADLTVASLDAVGQVWPYRWSRRATVQLPADAHDMARMLGVGGVTGGLGGLTTSEGSGSRGGQALRVTLNPTYFPTMVPLARQILLRHELTHVAQHGLDLSGVPQWLTEGLAEHVGYEGSGVARSYVAADLLAEVRAGTAPTRFPRDADFAFAAEPKVRTMAYRSGWTVCEYIADTYGEPSLMRFYRAVTVAPGSSRARVERASRQVLSATTAQLTAGWQSWLRGSL
ncbi:MAG: hypothetical protein WAN48_02095, partial [Actinomycetes bacterium]